MPAVKQILAAVVLAVLVAGAGVPRANAGDGVPAEVGTMLAEINAVRAQFGLPPVGIDGRLTQAAQDYSRQLAAQGRLSHGDFARRMAALGPGYGYVAENLAAGLPGSSAVVKAWMKSPAHRANLLQPSVNVVGVAHAGAVWTLILAGRGA